jgi:DNA adenine methylase
MPHMLSKEERAELRRHEETIATARKFRLLEAQALKAIRDKRLYRADYPTFEDYCRYRWGFTRIQGNRLCTWAEVAENLIPIGITPPARESHARPLSRLTPQQQRKAWSAYLAKKPVIHKARHIEAVCEKVERMPVDEGEIVNSESCAACPTADKRVNSPLSWYGSKSGLAERITSLLPPHIRYIEAFCGSAAVLFRKKPSQIEIINDIDAEVVNFFRVLRDDQQSEQLRKLLEHTPYARDEFDFCRENPDSDDLVEQARRFFVRCRQSYAGIVDAHWSFSLTSNRASQFNSPIEQLEAITHRFRKVQVENTDFRRLLKKSDLPDTTIFLDPPYLLSEDGGPAHGAVRKYRHTFSADDHVDLLEIITGFKNARVLLSGYRTKLYDQHLGKWKRYEFPVRVNAALVPTSGERSTKRTESLWCNF